MQNDPLLEEEGGSSVSTAAPKYKLRPMGPLAASSTVVNLVLATGPFTYPYGFVKLGPIISLILLIVTGFLAYITATFQMETLSISNAARSKKRQGTLFEDDCYTSEK